MHRQPCAVLSLLFGGIGQRRQRGAYQFIRAAGGVHAQHLARRVDVPHIGTDGDHIHAGTLTAQNAALQPGVNDLYGRSHTEQALAFPRPDLPQAGNRRIIPSGIAGMMACRAAHQCRQPFQLALGAIQLMLGRRPGGKGQHDARGIPCRVGFGGQNTEVAREGGQPRHVGTHGNHAAAHQCQGIQHPAGGVRIHAAG